MNNLVKFALAVTLGGLALAGCEKTAEPEPAGKASITAEELHQHIETLSSDAFEGRAPASLGEEKTINYLRDEFQRLGLEPGNGDSYFQEVPLVSITGHEVSDLVVRGEGEDLSFEMPTQMVAFTTRVVDEVAIEDSEMVFVGYGIVAPEYNWNDYEGLDMEGKTAVILVNDPGYATRDPALFDGYAMTYYGRWTYKYEEAMRQGADAAIVIHETGPAGYPWEVVRNSWTGPQFYAESPDRNMGRVKVEGWVTSDSAQAIFRAAGLDLDELTAAAATPGFEPVPLGLTASVSLKNTIQYSRSNNVIAWLPGSETPDEYFIYMAHWDHLGKDPSLEGDQIYNGALDNASGTAALLELAEAFATLPEPPKRSIVFAAVAAEEQGLLGSQHYANNPPFPLDQTVAGLNMDGMNIIGPTHDITIVGFGKSELDGYMERAAAGQGRVIAPNPDVEKGYYYRSDHFNLAKKGVPMIYPDSGIDHVEFGAEWGKAQYDQYTAERYHSPADEYNPEWDLTGAEQDTKLYFMVGREVAGSAEWPNWKPGTEFRAIRDQSLTGNGN